VEPASKKAKRGDHQQEAGAVDTAHEGVEVKRARASCCVVGIGSSAGGLEALTDFFKALPQDSGLAFVLVPHLDPTRQSHLAELLNNVDGIQVGQVKDSPAVQPNHAYVIPPNAYLEIREGRLVTIEPFHPRGLRMPIDHFFRSLAADQGENAIAVVMSGAGTDGTLGLKEIKAQGGLTIAQQPNSAEFDSMPRSAISTGMIDLVLSPKEMPEEISEYASHPYVKKAAVVEEEEASPTTEEKVREKALAGIIDLLNLHIGYDFSNYKRGTVVRRIERRMGLRHIRSHGEYLEFMRSTPEEVEWLFRDLLIGVTRFFREPQAWAELERHVLPRLCKDLEDGDTIRGWVPGCATGEEAYTLAILLLEAMEKRKKRCAVQIFASDIDEESLNVGRVGMYPENIAGDVTPERMKGFFDKIESDHKFRVSKRLRESVVFAKQNLISDPPFSRIALISCRNVLIYLNQQLQNDVQEMFHFALNPGGYLFLGTAEAVSEDGRLFETVSKKWRIFRRVERKGEDRPRFPLRRGRKWAPLETPPERETGTGKGTGARFTDWAKQVLVSHYAPACVLVNRDREVVYYTGATQDYLMQPMGVPTKDITVLARNGLTGPLRSAIRRAVKSGESAVVEEAGVRRGKKMFPVRIVVVPLLASEHGEGMLLISFEEVARGQGAPPAPPPEPAQPGKAMPDADETAHLEEELRITREDFSATVEQLATVNEEHRASHEEMMSINEELQSANEELETSKEELQSLNEEMTTVNQQLQAKVEELERTTDDLSNLLTSTEVATLFLDRQFRITRFTPTIRTLFNLIPSDVGRPITDIAQKTEDGTLLDEAAEVLRTLKVHESEVTGPGGGTFLRRILPYYTEESRIEGVVVTFIDISERKKSEQQRELLLAELNHRVKNMLATVRAVASQTIASSKGLQDFKDRFDARVQALSRAHALLSRSHWGASDLGQIIRQEISPYVEDMDARVAVEGPPVSLTPAQALPLTLILHELVTNATKYGSLREDGGQVSIRWRTERRDSSAEQVHLEWRERGGPRVQPPTTRGFGTSMIERSASYELDGAATLDFESAGVMCALSFPLADSGEPRGRPQPA
jgi:two-component system CheB/CheR fusion protein